MISSTVLTLVVIPAIYSLWKERELRQRSAETVLRETTPTPAPAGGPRPAYVDG